MLNIRFHVLNMGELINIYDVARALIRSKNLIPDEDVEIRIAGLRKGEKLIEELYTEEERKNLSRTKGSRIFSLKRTETCPFDINQIISNFEQIVVSSGSEKKLSQIITKLFPSIQLK